MHMTRQNFNLNLMPEMPENRAGKPKKSFRLAGLSFFLGMILAVGGLGYALDADPLSIVAGNGVDKLSIQKTPSERLIAEGSVIDIAKKAQSSVVGIQAQTGQEGALSKGSEGRSNESVGSGVIIKSNGFIMTNAHVVKDANSILVTIRDEKVPAELVGIDPSSDIAVIRVRKDNLVVARLGEAKKLQVGELAVAIGSPFGFQHSVTAGVISALGRNVTVGHDVDRPKTYTNLIQTDAAINPGNSGGALINQKGEVVGINTLIYSTNGVSQGIGFAIPVEEAEKVASELIDQGHVRYPFIGVEGQTVNPVLARERRLKTAQGALVIKVTPDGPAETSGLRAGDVIIKFGDEAISSMDDLVAAVRHTGIEKVAKVHIKRDGADQVLELKTSRRPASFN